MFEHLVITAPDARRAKQFEELIDVRIRTGLYPREIAFHVVPDPPGRVGSGGATILALCALLKKANATAESFFPENRVVLLHGGGESRRLPMYAPEGKLFAPVPISTSALAPPVLLDLHIASLMHYPWTERAQGVARGEVVVASGDALLQFDPHRIPPREPGVRGIAIPASYEAGSRHGVFQLDPATGAVVDFHQKKPPEFLAEHAAINAEHCAMDSGLFAFDAPAACSLVALADQITDGERLGDALAGARLAIDLYREIVIACVARESAEQLAERLGEAKISADTIEAIHQAMRSHPLSAVAPEDCFFRHLGTISDYREACPEMSHMRAFYSRAQGEVPASSSSAIVMVNAVAEAQTTRHASGMVMENCLDASLQPGPGPNMVMGVRGKIPGTIGPGICVDQRRISCGDSVTLVYAETDSLKPVGGLDQTMFCGIPVSQWLHERQLQPSDIPVDASSIDLIDVPLFALNADAAMLSGYWELPADPSGWAKWFKASPRISMVQANDRTDPLRRDEERRAIRRRLLRESILSDEGWREASSHDVAEAIDKADGELLRQRIDGSTDPMHRQYRTQTLARVFEDGPPDHQPLAIAIRHAPHSIWSTRQWDLPAEGSIIARAPIRFDLAGGWSDTPPYTNRFGGHVVNVAIDLNGRPPIEVRIRRISEPVIAIRSCDPDAEACIRDVSDISGFAQPGQALSLVRAALWLSGIRRNALTDRSLHAILAEAGGIEITTHAKLPTGSGLGTSSILGAAILAGLHEAMGMPLQQPELIALVLELERTLTTGGGWQDQVGGVVPAVKSAITLPGLAPVPAIEQLPSALFTDPRHTERMTLYYTGVTRLAKNILQDVVSQVNDATPAYLYTVDEIRRQAGLARDAILAEDLDAMASVLNLTWRSKCLIHESTTNELVDQLLHETRDHWCGASLLGAGGGGFVLFISPDKQRALALGELLERREGPAGACLYQMSLNIAGLTVERD